MTAPFARTENQLVLRAARPMTVEMPRCAHFIDGHFVESMPTSTHEVIDPARGTVIAQVPQGDESDVSAAVAAATAAAPLWAARTPQERSAVLLALADAMAADRERLRSLEALNCGKPPAVTADDIDSAIDTFRFMAGAGRSTTTIAAGDYVEDVTSLILREPLGVIGMITPWNYPLLMVAWKLAPALMMGNAVVLKPSEVTPLTTLRLAELAQDILPAGLLNVINGSGSTVGAALSSHPDIDMIALTGSVRAGRAVADAAAKNVVQTHLELGGKAPVIVCSDADVDRAAEAVAEAGFWNTGQECGAACRVLAHDSIAEQLAEKIVAAVSSYRLADPEIGQNDTLGPIMYQGHYRRVMDAIEGAVERGAEVLLGARGDDSTGYWIEPTVLKVRAGDPISLDEVFGPVVTIETYSDESEGVARANETQYGLTASVFTRDVATALSLAKVLTFGSVNINTHLALPTEMPWSGCKRSGYGRDLSAYALDDYSRTKHVALSHARG